MSKRLGWMLGVVVLVSIGLLVACGSQYNSSSDGLLLVGSQGSAVLEAFSFNLSNGHVSSISNPTATSGSPSAMVMDPAGTYAYVLINQSSIAAFKVNSDGTTTAVGSPVPFLPETVFFQGTTTPDTPAPAVVPSTMTMDPAGKFLFVADRATTDSTGLYVPGAVSVFTIGSGGTLTEVAGSPFLPANPATTLQQSGLDIVSVAPTPTVFPPIGINGVHNSVCTGLNPPTTEYLYAVDKVGYQVFQFAVNTASGVLTLSTLSPIATDAIPVGIAVDPCNRFVYVSDSKNDRVSAYTICNGTTTQSSACPLTPDGSLREISSSPFSLQGSANGPGPLVVDPYGKYVYVLDTLSNTINPLTISPVSGSLAAGSPATVATGSQPTSIAIRADDNWLFVTNFNPPSVSQYAITPATGVLTVQQAIVTDNYPWGVAVK